jgi:histidine triad (HIT) family protein
MASIFTKIINGEIPCYKVAENEQFFAFLDIGPVTEGHTLVVPKKETDYLFDIEGEEYQALFAFTKQVAAAIKKSFVCDRVGMTVVGLEVPHAHIHLIPINSMEDMNFYRDKKELTSNQFEMIAEKIASNF